MSNTVRSRRWRIGFRW